jgi:murein DD-endopeptidase MepM/ murein hydrolase activator NlpD
MKKIEPKGETFEERFQEFYHPPLLPMPDIPVALHHGSFMARRRFDVHTGVDLYAPKGAEVYAVEAGEVVRVRPFTGPKAGTPFWNDTLSIEVEGHSGIITYGEVFPAGTVEPGLEVAPGRVIGYVDQVLKEDKGKPMSMLHFAIHTHGWLGLLEAQEDPEQESFYDLQVDPTLLLIQLKAMADRRELLREIGKAKRGKPDRPMGYGPRGLS